jgi:hypothetical protein
MDKASSNNVQKQPSRQGSSQISAQLILKEPRTSNNKASLEIKSNDASSNISNSPMSECSSESNRKATEIAARYGKIMEQTTRHTPAMHADNARRERSSDPLGEGEVTAKMMEPNPEAENKREKINKEETKQVMNHNQKDDDELPIMQEDINASGKELAKKHHHLDDSSPDHELQQLEITLRRNSKPNLTTNNNTRAPTTAAQLLSFKAMNEQEQNQSK